VACKISSLRNLIANDCDKVKRYEFSNFQIKRNKKDKEKKDKDFHKEKK
jgi:hypothetical protein